MAAKTPEEICVSTRSHRMRAEEFLVNAFAVDDDLVDRYLAAAQVCATLAVADALVGQSGANVADTLSRAR